MQAKQLVEQAFHRVNIFDPNEDITGNDLQQGLEILNSVLASWSALSSTIPLLTNINVYLTPGVSEYIVSPLIIDFLAANVVDGDGLLSVLTEADINLANTFDYDYATGRPQYVYINPAYQTLNSVTQQPSSTIKFFPIPDENYNVSLKVKTVLDSTLKYESPLAAIPPYGLQALLYETARILADTYSMPLSQTFLDTYRRVQRTFKAANRLDMTVDNDNPFLSYRQYRPGIYYAG